jgi:GDPmannose 4,6-dehydratase
MNKALITGITGQDGAYLTTELLRNGYEVHGLRRRASTFNSARIDPLLVDIFEGPSPIELHYGDMTDSTSLFRIISRVKPTHIFNLAAQSHVGVSFESPEYAADADGMGTLRLLEIVKQITPETRIYQASTSELFGGDLEVTGKYDETSRFNPKSPYAAAKQFAYSISKIYRDSYNMFISNGILFNHESPLRGENFVTQKIVRAVAKISVGGSIILRLGNLDAIRDWGHAEDYVKAMRLILEAESPDDFVVASGEAYSVREFLEKVLKYLNVEFERCGSGLSEQYFDPRTGNPLVVIDQRYFRPNEVPYLRGDSTKIQRELGWVPEKTLDDLVSDMCSNVTRLRAL